DKPRPWSAPSCRHDPRVMRTPQEPASAVKRIGPDGNGVAMPVTAEACSYVIAAADQVVRANVAMPPRLKPVPTSSFPASRSPLPVSGRDSIPGLLDAVEPGTGARRMGGGFLALERRLELLEDLALAPGQLDRCLDHGAAQEVAGATAAR